MTDSIDMLVERKDSGNIAGIFNIDSVDDLLDTLFLTVLDITSGTRKITRSLINNRLLEFKYEMPNNIVNVIIQSHLQTNAEVLDEIQADLTLDIKEEKDSDGFSNCFIDEKQQCMKEEIELEFSPYDEYNFVSNRNHHDVKRLISDNDNANAINIYEVNSLNKLHPIEKGNDENESTHLVNVIRHQLHNHLSYLMMDSIAMLVERKDIANIPGIFKTYSVDDLVDTLLLTVLDITSGMRKVTRTLINNRLLEFKIEMPNNINVIIQYHLETNVEVLDEIQTYTSLDIKEEKDSDGFSSCFIAEKQQYMKKETELEFPPYDEYLVSNKNHHDVKILISDNDNINAINKHKLNSVNNFKLQPDEEGNDENELTTSVDVLRQTPSSDYSINDNFIGNKESNEDDKGSQMPSYKISDEENQSGEISYPCRVCGKSFPKPSNRKRHEKNHTAEKHYLCEICGKSFTHVSARDIHKRIHTGEKPYSCEICGKSFTQLSQRNQHKRIHTGEKAYNCSICGKAFRCRSSKVLHEYEHSEVEPYSRSICEKPFSTLSDKVQHENIHLLVEKPHFFSVCGKRFSEISNKNAHEKIHLNKKPYLCKICGKYFTSVSSRNKHKLTHTGEKPYSCEICGKSYTQPSSRDIHKRIHTGEKPYSCDICGKSFTRLSHRKRHKLIHTGEKPYSCEICGKSFTQHSSRDTHKRIHTGEKPYSCDICGKPFTDVSSRNKHRRIHTGEKPYSCEICGKSFTDVSSKHKHKRTHTGEKPYSCEICGKFFTQLSQMDTHKCIYTVVFVEKTSSLTNKLGHE